MGSLDTKEWRRINFAILVCHLRSVEHFLNSLAVPWGFCTLPVGAMWVSTRPAVGPQQPARLDISTVCRQLGCFAGLCPVLVHGEMQALFLCVLSLFFQIICLMCNNWSCVWCLLSRGLSIWAAPALPQRRQTSAWPGKKPLLQLALLYSTGVFSAMVAEKAPRCRNLSGTCKGSNLGGSEQENHWSEGSEKHSRVSVLTWTASWTVITANIDLISAMLSPDPCSSGSWVSFA